MYKKVVLSLVSFFVGLYFLKEYDKNIFLFINPDSKGPLSSFFIFLTSIMDGIIILLIMSLMYRIRKEYFLPGVFSLALAGICVYLLKNYFGVTRPVHHFNPEEITILGRNLKNFSFPSGHATAAMVLALYLKGGSSHWFTFLLIGISGGLSRVLIGVHFPSDIWAGAWLGYFLTRFVYLLFEKNKALQKFSRSPYLFYLSILLGAASIVGYIFFYSSRYKEVDHIMIPMLLISGVFLLFSLIQKIMQQRAESNTQTP